jgi:hypothetical protein
MTCYGCEISLYSGRWNRKGKRALMTDVWMAVGCAMGGCERLANRHARSVNDSDGCRVRARFIWVSSDSDNAAKCVETVRLRLLGRLKPELERQVRVEMCELTWHDAHGWVWDIACDDE